MVMNLQVPEDGKLLDYVSDYSLLKKDTSPMSHTICIQMQ